jgi:hypothetical protein
MPGALAGARRADQLFLRRVSGHSVRGAVPMNQACSPSAELHMGSGRPGYRSRSRILSEGSRRIDCTKAAMKAEPPAEWPPRDAGQRWSQ